MIVTMIMIMIIIVIIQHSYYKLRARRRVSERKSRRRRRTCEKEREGRTNERLTQTRRRSRAEPDSDTRSQSCRSFVMMSSEDGRDASNSRGIARSQTRSARMSARRRGVHIALITCRDLAPWSKAFRCTSCRSKPSLPRAANLRRLLRHPPRRDPEPQGVAFAHASPARSLLICLSCAFGGLLGTGCLALGLDRLGWLTKGPALSQFSMQGARLRDYGAINVM